MSDENEEEAIVAEGHLHLTDLADLAATDRLLDRLAARAPLEDGDDEVAELLLALALDVDAHDEWSDSTTLPELDADLEAVLASWLATDAAEAPDEAAHDAAPEPAVAEVSTPDEAATLRRPRGEGRAIAWTPRRLVSPAVRVGAAAAVAAAAVTIGGLMTGEDGTSALPGLPGFHSSSVHVTGAAGRRVETLIQQAKDMVRAGRPAEAVKLYKQALDLVPQVDAAQRPALTQALVELRTVLVASPGVSEPVPLPPPVAAGETGTGVDIGAGTSTDPGSPVLPSPTPVLPTLDPTTETSAPEPSPTETSIGTPTPTPSEEPTSTAPEPTPTDSTPEPSGTSVDPQTGGEGGDGGDGGDDGSGSSVAPEVSPQVSPQAEPQVQDVPAP